MLREVMPVRYVHGAHVMTPSESGQWVRWVDVQSLARRLADELEDSEPGVGMGGTVERYFELPEARSEE